MDTSRPTCEPWLVLIAVIVGMVSAGCLDPAPTFCQTTADCFKGWVCDTEANVCVRPGASSDTGPIDVGDTAVDTGEVGDVMVIDAVDAADTTDTGPADAEADTARDTTTGSDAVDADTEAGSGDVDDTSVGDGGAFPVPDVGAPVMWFRADDLQERHFEIDNGENVVKWWENRAPTGTGLDLHGPVDGAELPKYIDQDALIDGHAAVRFDGRSTTLMTAEPNDQYVETDEATLFMVVRNRNVSHVGELLAACNCGTDGTSCSSKVEFDGSERAFFARIGEGDNGFSVTTKGDEAFDGEGWYVMWVVMSSTPPSVAIRQTAHDAYSYGSENSDAGEGEAWHFNQIGNRCVPGDDDWLSADVAELILFDTRFSSGERTAITTHLLSRYGL